MIMPFLLVVFKISFFIALMGLSFAQETEKKQANFSEQWESLVTQKASIHVKEGTWMSIDLSPDGQWIVFDLLGDLYLIPWQGGQAKALTHGTAWEMQPTFSPDGQWIAYTSDVENGDHLWVMSVKDPSQKWQVSKETDRLTNSPAWTPDSQWVAGRKHFTNTRSLGSGEIFLYHFKGEGSGIQMTKKASDQKDEGEPAFSPDGKWLYYSQDLSNTQNFEYNKNVNEGIYGIKRLDRLTGEIKGLIDGAGGAIRPTPSPDGKSLVFIKRIEGRSWLWLKDLISGTESPIYGPIERDLQETWAIHGVYPRIAFSKDQWIVFWAQGQLQRYHVPTKKHEIIPFEVKDERSFVPALRFPVNFTDNQILKMPNHPKLFKQGIIFQALGRLYHQAVEWQTDTLGRSFPKANGESQALPLDDQDFYFYPSIDAKEEQLLYVRWDDQRLGQIESLSLPKLLKREEQSPKVLAKNGHYAYPTLSANGEYLAYQRISSGYITSPRYALDTGLYVLHIPTQKEILVHANGRSAHFRQDESFGEQLYFLDYTADERCLKQYHLQKNTTATLACSSDAYQMLISNHLDMIASISGFQALISAYVPSVLPMRISAKDHQTPTIKISENHAGYDLHLWQDLVYYQEGNQIYFYHTKDAFLDPKSPRFHQTQIQLHLPTETQNPPVLISHARIITANGDQVLEDAGIYIENQRIKAIAKSEDLLEAFSFIPNLLKLDAKGKTLMPGLIDVHAHASYSNDRIIPKQNWQLYASLAFGVTTLHDPSSDSMTVFSTSEMLKSNRLVGPRLFSTGTILYGAKGDYHASIQKVEDATMHVQKLKQMGAFSVKSYNQPQRIQRQQVLWAAKQLEMMVVPEGGSVFYHNMTQIIDGHTGIEHAIPLAHLYEDVLQLWSATKVGYTPTFNVSYGGIMGENYWYQESAVYENERLKRFVPSALIESRSRRPFTAPIHEWNHIDVAKHSKKLLDRGVLVNLGAHGQREGLGAHWEMWSMVQGGFSPLDAIKAGTINGAKYLGLDRDLGSIEVGKLADLILIDGNPLADIRESEKVAFVMVSGKLYDAKTMGELTTQSEIDQMQAKHIPHFFFEDSQIRFDHDDLSHCGCEP